MLRRAFLKLTALVGASIPASIIFKPKMILVSRRITQTLEPSFDKSLYCKYERSYIIPHGTSLPKLLEGCDRKWMDLWYGRVIVTQSDVFIPYLCTAWGVIDTYLVEKYPNIHETGSKHPHYGEALTFERKQEEVRGIFPHMPESFVSLWYGAHGLSCKSDKSDYLLDIRQASISNPRIFQLLKKARGKNENS